MYIKLCYVEHNTVSPAASGWQHVTTTFISLLPPSEAFGSSLPLQNFLGLEHQAFMHEAVNYFV